STGDCSENATASRPRGDCGPRAPSAPLRRGSTHDRDTDHDDDALSWGDADDATHVDAAHNPVAVKDRGVRDPEAPETSGALIGFGVFGGLYLLYT
ncbi:hypothetical protein IAE22_34065, partial [Bacillus sp. S34]|nr:hypothetical protein [Bacillus sp. S34]